MIRENAKETNPLVDTQTRRLLLTYAKRYETASFLEGDPSWFMHQVEGDANREATAFVASCLSFGNRSQFMPKIQGLLDCADGDMDAWIRNGRFAKKLSCGCKECFYRFFTHGDMNGFLSAYRTMLNGYGTLGEYVKQHSGGDGLAAVRAICGRFGSCGSAAVVPKNAQSACKRVCMFLRWMVRSGSPVDLGLWSDFIDRRTLVMPLDTHVVHQAMRLGLLSSESASMSAARRLTATLAQVFPDDPLRGDFALFGYGVSHSKTVLS